MIRKTARLSAWASSLSCHLALHRPDRRLRPCLGDREEEYHLHPKDLHMASMVARPLRPRAAPARVPGYKEVCAACHGSTWSHSATWPRWLLRPELKAIANQWAIEAPSGTPTPAKCDRRRFLRTVSRTPMRTRPRRALRTTAPTADLSLIKKARITARPMSIRAHRLCQAPANVKKFPAAKTGRDSITIPTSNLKSPCRRQSSATAR